MKLQIDNLDGAGLRDYTAAVDNTQPARIARRLNRTAELSFRLVANAPDFLVPVGGARVLLTKAAGQALFTGFLREPPVFEYLGWRETGPVYRYSMVVLSDDMALDRKRLPYRSAFVARTAGDALRQLVQDMAPVGFDLSGIEDLDAVPWYAPSAQKAWSEHAAELAVRARACWRVQNDAVTFSALGANTLALSEADAAFLPQGLKLRSADGVVNDLTVIGRVEPQSYVKDYFVGDGSSLRFYLSQTPFTRSNRTVIDEEYIGTVLDSTRWSATDPGAAVSLSGGKLAVAGGTGSDGQTTVLFAEKIELGGAFVLQHGDISFSAASDGVIGGLYQGNISIPGCVAGFRVMANGTASDIQALVGGVLTGPVITTVAGHRYVLTTRCYSIEIYRSQQVFHSSLRPAGNGRGGAGIAADVRVVLEVHDINPADPASMVAPSAVLYDGIISSAPGFCTYGLINAASMHCDIAFTRLIQAIDTEVRSALPGEPYRTRLAGSLSDGAECLVNSDPALQFFPQSVPAANELIVVKYRGGGRALARVINPASIAALANGTDDGVRSAVLNVQSPPPRTAVDCENAALALLDDATGKAWSGEYQTWSDFLPGGAQDALPGDAVQVSASSRGAAFSAVMRNVEIEIRDWAGEHSVYTMEFADDAAAPVAFEFQQQAVAGALDAPALPVDQVGGTYLGDLKEAEVTDTTSTSATLDAGAIPPAGGGIEVRWTDFGWGPDNDRNLAGRFSTRTFTLPRLSRVEDYYLRQYDASVPPKYSRYSTALHIDLPL